MKDREDEEEIQQNFCFVLAEEMERDRIISYHAKRLLDLDEHVLPLFSAAESAANCLMLHTTEQDHGVMEEEEERKSNRNKTEPSTKAVVNKVANGEEGERGRELTGVEERQVRQQATVVVYNRKDGGITEETDFEEDKEIATVETAPSKSVHVILQLLLESDVAVQYYYYYN